MKQKTRCKNFGNIGYWYWPHKSHISRSLFLNDETIKWLLNACPKV